MTEISEEEKNARGGRLAARLESLLAPYLSNDDDSDFEIDVDEHTTLSLHNEGYDEDDLEKHILLQNNSPNLKSLTIGEDDSFFPEDEVEQWEATGIYLGNHSYLKQLGFGYVGGVDSYSFSAMCKGLARNSSISKLVLTSHTIFNDSHWRHFLRISLTWLFSPEEDSTIKLDRKGILLLALALTKFSSLKKVELVKLCGGEQLDDELMPHIFDALGNYHPELTSIKLSGTTLGMRARDALEKLDITEDQDDGPEDSEDLFGRLQDLLSGGSRYSSPQMTPEPVIPTEVQPGIICKVDGLKSEGGKKLNGRRCAILRYIVDEGRYEVRMERESRKDATFALKDANLSPLPKLVLPTHNQRGSDSSPRSLCELLLYHKGSGPDTEPTFSPSRITLAGYAGQQLNHIGYVNLMWLVQCQLEQLSGVVGLASYCQNYDENGAERVLFALLEGDPMYIDVLLQVIHWTGQIDHEDCDPDIHDEFNNCPPTKLTPDQDSKPYVKLMSTGPFRLLVEMTKYKFNSALWAATKESEFYLLFVQRLLRLVGRETLGTCDGVKLGPTARKILMQLLPGISLNKPLRDTATADDLLKQTSRDAPCQFLNEVSGETLNAMFFSR
ncbi:hypothetical protein ACHAXR_006038 [Thalassiosira sp. AJA248-18]